MVDQAGVWEVAVIEFSHVVTDREGLHARPVTVICCAARKWSCGITVSCGSRVADARDLLQLMGLMARRGDTLVFKLDGADEQDAAAAIETAIEML